MKLRTLAGVLIAGALICACDKPADAPTQGTEQGGENPGDKPGDNPGTHPAPEIPDADFQLAMDRTTKVLYYGDRRTEGVYNYFFGLGDKEFIKDDEGDDAASEGGHIVYFDLYSTEGAESWESAELPDGTYTLTDTKTAGTIDSYYTRLQINEDGNQKSVDFTEGWLEVETSAFGKLITAKFTLKDGSTLGLAYEGELVFGDPDEGADPGEATSPIQEDVDEEFVFAQAAYYGDPYNGGTDNYGILLTTKMPTSDGYLAADSYMVSLSLYSAASSIISLTPGTYQVADTYAAGTVEPGFFLFGYYTGSYVIKASETGATAEASTIKGGSATVSETSGGYRIVLDLTTTEGKSIKGTYEGYFDISDESGSDEGGNTSLEGDYRLDLSKAEAELQYYGDYYENGLANWVLDIVDTAGDEIVIELVTPATSTTEIPIPEKQYNMSVDNGVGVIAGSSEGDYSSGTWYYDMSTADDDGYVTGYAAAIEGNVKLAKSGDETTVTFEFVDELGNLFCGTWTGVIPAADNLSGLSLQSKSQKRAEAKTSVVRRSGVKRAR